MAGPTITVRISPELMRRVDEMKWRRRVSKNQLVIEYIECGLAADEEWDDRSDDETPGTGCPS